jgi:hypothetical protein
MGPARPNERALSVPVRGLRRKEEVEAKEAATVAGITAVAAAALRGSRGKKGQQRQRGRTGSASPGPPARGPSRFPPRRASFPAFFLLLLLRTLGLRVRVRVRGRGGTHHIGAASRCVRGPIRRDAHATGPSRAAARGEVKSRGAD